MLLICEEFPLCNRAYLPQETPTINELTDSLCNLYSLEILFVILYFINRVRILQLLNKFIRINSDWKNRYRDETEYVIFGGKNYRPSKLTPERVTSSPKTRVQDERKCLA